MMDKNIKPFYEALKENLKDFDKISVKKLDALFMTLNEQSRKAFYYDFINSDINRKSNFNKKYYNILAKEFYEKYQGDALYFSCIASEYKLGNDLVCKTKEQFLEKYKNFGESRHQEYYNLFVEKINEGELYFWSTPDFTWKALWGSEGYFIAKDGKVLVTFMTGIN